MKRIVIDPAALLHLTSTGYRQDPTRQLVAPNAIRSASLGLLLRDVRVGRISEQEALGLHERITETKIRLLGDRVSRRTAWRIAREHDLDGIWQAEYLAITMLQADALVALDPGLAALAEEIVPLVPISGILAE